MSRKRALTDEPRKITWHITDDGVRMSDCRKELDVCSSGATNNWRFLIEETSYTGQFTTRGRTLATRLCRLLNDVERHSGRFNRESV